MQNRCSSHTILTIICFVCALGVTALIYRLIPVGGDLWTSMVWFTVFASLTELLAVSISEFNNSKVTPTPPVLWSAICVLGPIPAIAVCIIGSLISKIITYSSRFLGSQLQKKKKTELLDSLIDDRINLHEKLGFKDHLAEALSKIGIAGHSRPLLIRIESFLIHVSAMVIGAAFAGAVYSALSGDFLIHHLNNTNVFIHFVLPFFALVVVYMFIEQGIKLAELVTLESNDTPILLRAELYFVKQIIPICKAQLFMVIVALLLSYLYAHVGVVGLVLAVMPVLALRDFFHQWVAEREAYVNTITTLATYMQHYHPYTRGHLKRVADMSEKLAREINLPLKSIIHIRTAGLLHDIGKIAVSEEILDKRGKLTEEEWEKIKEHPIKGAEIISHLEFLDDTYNWIKYHHRWYNGDGYPADNLRASSIPIESAVISIVDAFDAMTDDRELTLDWKCDACGYVPDDDQRPGVCPECGAAKRRYYREPRSIDEAVDELKKGSGTQFHPEVVDAFLKMIHKDGIKPNAN